MDGWNYADVWETIAEIVPEATAVAQGNRRLTWGEFDARANGVARALLDAGAAHQDKVAQYLYNCPEYLESFYAACKAGLVPVNTNYRYMDDELVYLWDNADAVAVVFHGAFAERIDHLRDRVPRVKTWLWVDDDTGPCPDWAVPYETAATRTAERTEGPWGRSGDDLMLLYTGGTTGMPKGVMWAQHEHFLATSAANTPAWLEGEPGPDVVRSIVTGPGLVSLPGCPLMHGTGLFTQLINLSTGGSAVLTSGRHFDVEEFLDVIEQESVNIAVIVGDAFSKPILKALDAAPDRWDLSSLVAMVSSGVMWSEPVKERLLDHHASMMLIDAFSSSEAVGMGQSVSAAGAEGETARFTLGERARVIAEDGTDVAPGSGQRGRVAVKGYVPRGYYKDEEKTAETFLELDGDRFVLPGDWATVEEDGTLTLLGRGSVCINTGGEKVFPEEVEEILKTHPTVDDAVVVGVPDDRFGESITAVVQPHAGEAIDDQVLIEHVKSTIAHYKAPRRVVPIDTIGRAPNAKVDYKRLRTYAMGRLGLDS
jgi:fatty-acyl-CoA synthase